MARTQQLEARFVKLIKDRKATIAIIGLGYVGLPLAVAFSKAGFKVVGFDKSAKKVAHLKKGRSHTSDVSSHDLRDCIKNKKFFPTTSAQHLTKCNAILICVPTPLNKVKEPDISFVLSAVRVVKKYIRRGQLIILESTVYPGTTEEILKTEIEDVGLRVGQDFFLCFSPERIDPGNREFPLSRIPKVVGGVSRSCTKIASCLYRQIINQVVPVSSPKVAEMAKLLENTFRIVNIGLINELIPLSGRLGINLWEAIEAAKSKPFGFMPFYPGPGIGGHCVGTDPLYLSWKAKSVGSELRFIELASRINALAPGYVVSRINRMLNTQKKTIKGANILILGVSYKKDIGDIREAPAIEIMDELQALGAKIRYFDAFVTHLKLNAGIYKSEKITASLVSKQDLVVLLTAHTDFNYENILKSARCIFDTRNALWEFKSLRRKTIAL
jgi:UDP-N-acetyl-D-glucosamine dehydrogenase